MLAYHNVGDTEKATEAFHMFSQRCRSDDQLDRVRDVAGSILDDSGLVN